MADVVITPVGADPRPRPRRSLEERVYARWPRTYRFGARLLVRLPPRSTVRQTLLRRSALSGWSAWSRGDLDIVLVRFAPDCQMGVPPEFVEVGMRAVYHGHAGHYEYTADLRGAWERVDLRPIEIVDAGDRVAILGRLQIHARGSGVELESEAADVVWIDRGLIVRERVFLDWAAGLRAAEIPESAVTGSTLVGRPTTAVRLGSSDS